MRATQVKRFRYNGEMIRIVQYPNGSFYFQTSCTESIKAFETAEKAIAAAKKQHDKNTAAVRKRIADSANH